MNPERFGRIQALFELACDLDPEERAGFLTEECAGDADLRQEVEQLLDFDGHIRTPPATPDSIDGYRILRVVGHGGMGTVYEAEQDNPRRRVALKTMRPGLSEPALADRFRREIQVLGRLQHPGIAQIFGAGEADFGGGVQPFFAMEFVDGVPLTEYVSTRNLGREDRLRLFVRVCEAADHAHRQGVVHRDLKPDNVLVVAPEGGSGTPRPKILDFGIARVVDAEHGLTFQTGVAQLMGTLAYMSPEQASGGVGASDARSDVYSLGVLLFELLSGGLPLDVRGRGLHEALAAIIADDRDRLSRFDHTLRGDLDTITQKALEKDPHRRYATVAELSNDVSRHLRNEPIQARPTSAIYQLVRFTRRHRSLVWSTTGVVAALLAGAITATIFAVDARRTAAESRWQAYRAHVFAASATTRTDPLAAARHLADAPADQRGWEWRHLETVLDGGDMRFERLVGDAGPVGLGGHLAVSSDGEWIVAAAADRSVVIWRMRDGRIARVLPAWDAWKVALPACGPPILAIGSGDGTIRVHDIATGDTREVARIPESPQSIAWDPEGKWIAIAGTEQRSGIWLWSEERGLGSFEFPTAPHVRRAVAWTTLDGEALGAAVFADTLYTWWPERGEIAARRTSLDSPQCLAFVGGGTKLVAGTYQRAVLLLDAETLEVRRRWTGHRDAVFSVTGAPDAPLVASSSRDGTVRIWNLDEQDAVGVLRAREGSCVFIPGGSRLAYVHEGEIRIREPNPAGVRVLEGHSSYVYWLAWSPDGAQLATAAAFVPELFLWDARSGSRVHAGAHMVKEHLAFAPDARAVLTGSGAIAIDGSDDAWTLRPGPLPLRPGLRLSPANVVSGDGELLASGNCLSGGPVDVRRAADREFLYRVGGTLWGAAFSPDGQHLAVAGVDGRIDILDARTGVVEQHLVGHGGSTVYCVDFHPDGTRLASGGNDGMIQLWDTASWRSVLGLRGHTSYVKMVAFDPTGTRLASASGDYSVRIWEALPR